MFDRVRRGGRVLLLLGKLLRKETSEENITFMAGSIAYYAFVSLMPFLLVVFVILSTINWAPNGDAQATVQGFGAYLAPGASDTLSTAIENATSNSSLGLVGGLALLWGMFKIFRTLDQAFSDIYESEHLNSMADQIGDAVFVFGAMGVAIAIASTLDQLIPSLGSATMDAAVATLVSIFGLTLAFFPMFYVFPDEDVSVREVLPGTILAATGWELLEGGFQHYVAIAGKSDTYGVLGAILLLITWLYLIGLVLLIGAALNAVISGRSEDVPTVDWGHVWRTGERRTADPERNTSSTQAGEFTDPLTELHAALEANADVDEITVQVGDETVTLPRPDDPTVATNTIQRPQFLGGQKVTGNVVFHWEADEAEDGDGAFDPSPKQFIARRRSEGDD